MSNQYSYFEVEPFELNLDGDEFGAFEMEIADEAWQSEVGRRQRFPRRGAGYRHRPARSPRQRAPQRRYGARPSSRPVRPARPSPHPRRPPRRPRRPRPRLPVAYPYPWPPPEAGGDERVERSSEFVRWVQSSLNQVMNLRLPVDGVMGPATRSAIRSFQERFGLPASGFAGPDTVQALVAAQQAGAPGGSLPGTGNGGAAAAPPETAPTGPGSEGEHWLGEVGLSRGSRPGNPPPYAPRRVGPVFRFECSPGCAPHTAHQCRVIVRRAIQDAIWLAENATVKLEARDNEALRLFRFFFGDPLRPVPWANNRPAADLVAGRFRAVARGFRTRVPHIRCSPLTGCNAFVEPRAAPSATNPLPRNTIFLCPRFWSATIPGTVPRFWRAAILLHEMLHLLFWEFFGHLPRPGDPEERRRDNSHCYEAFALRVAQHGADPGDVASCRARPA